MYSPQLPKVSHRISVTLSGVVGAGKSTAAKAIVQALRSAGCPAEHIRFQEFTDVRFASLRRKESPKAQPSPTRSAPRWTAYQRRRMTIGIAAGYLLLSIRLTNGTASKSTVRRPR